MGSPGGKTNRNDSLFFQPQCTGTGVRKVNKAQYRLEELEKVN